MRRTPRWFSQAAQPFSLDGVFVINLDRRPDRWVAISRVCAQGGLPLSLVNRVAAVDGSRVDAEACHRCGFVSRLGLMRLREPAEHHIWGMDLNRGALGCALSHIQLWSRIASLSQVDNTATTTSPSLSSSSAAKASPKSCFLVLEDDAEPVAGADSTSHSFFEELQRRMRHVPPDWELVYVGGLDTAGQCSAMQVAPGVAHVPQYHRTTSAYLLTTSGARRLLATCVPLTFQLDTVMTMKVGLPAGQLAASEAAVPYVLDPVSYTLQPPLMQQSAALGTDIQQVVE
ncbi:glycosyl transferase-like protein [Lotmaria passim]